VAITRHLLQQAPEAILIPEEVRIDLAFVDLAREFSGDPQGRGLASVQRDRVFVGTVFVLNRETLRSWARQDGMRLPAATVRMPDPLEQRYQPLLFTTIRVYRDHVLEDYDSGLTCPRPPAIEGLFRPGDTIQFYYELGDRPRLNGEVLARHTA
jgi:hypothetical protein